MSELKIQYRHVDTLSPHPLNEEIYGDAEDVSQKFINRIKKYGIVPLEITPQGVIISGHRRFEGAQAAGLEQVPCIVLPEDKCKDELWLKQRLISMNDQRIKGPRQIKLETDLIKEYDRAEAAARQKLGVAVPGQEGGTAAKKIAETIGVSEVTAQRAMIVGDVMDEAKAAGDTETVKELDEALDKGIKPAYEKAKKKRKAATQPSEKPEEKKPETAEQIVAGTVKLFSKAEEQLTELRETLRQINRRKGGEELNQQMIYGLDAQSLRDLDAAEAFIKGCKPVAFGCYQCGGKKSKRICGVCKDNGWIGPAAWLTMAKAEQEKHKVLEK